MVREQMIITDVARMQSGACIAGYSLDLTRPIRPVPPSGGGLDWLALGVFYGTILKPFTVIEAELIDERPDPPHCEDFVLDEPVRIDYLGRVPQQKVQKALNITAFPTIDAAFDGNVVSRRYLPPGSGERSIATVQVDRVDSLKIDMRPDDQTLRLRIGFRDTSGLAYTLPITDIGVRSECHYRLAERREPPDRIGAGIRRRLNNAQALHFRIGATRPFQPSSKHDAGCYLIVTGIYAEPDFRTVAWDVLFPDVYPPDGNPFPPEIASMMQNG